MMKRTGWWLGLSLLIFLGGCGKEKEKLPIDEEKLIAVLADVHIAEGAIQHLSGPIKDSLAEQYYEQIFAIQGVTEADFDTCMLRLRNEPDRLMVLYDKVLKHLEEMQTSTE